MLYIVSKICRFAATKLRILLSATFGAAWSVVEILVPEKMHWLTIVCTYILISFLMIKICAFPCKLQDALKGVVVLYGVTFVLAGAVHMLYYNTYAGYFIKQVILNDSDLLLFVMVSAVLLYLILVQFFKVKAYGDKICRVRIELCEQCIELKGMIDTGNVLTDPYSGKPVCVAQKTHFNSILSEINNWYELGYHMIPFSSLGCEQGVLEVITADNMYIYYKDSEIKVEKALIGLADTVLSADGEFDMLINARIVK